MFSKQEIQFMLDNYHALTNKELSELLGCKLWQVRAQCISMGLKRMEMEYWTPEQVGYLKKVFRRIGDKEIAETFNTRWPKNKHWTLKHIEKKRMYLGLKRTKQQLKAIRERNRRCGCWTIGNKHMWETRGVTPVKTVKKWGRYSYIKTPEGYDRLMRYTWEKVNGTVPKGFNVVRKSLLEAEDDINNLGINNGCGTRKTKLNQSVSG